MFMIAGLLILAAISMLMALYWHRKAIQIHHFIFPLEERYGEPDISGKKHYTDCASHRWLMKNVVNEDYSQSVEGFRDFMMNQTMIGTLAVGVLLGIAPVVIVYSLFQSYQLVGTSLILAILSVFILRGPGDLEMSKKLAKWQIDQDDEILTIGDLAYAKVTQKAMKSWMKELIVIGAVCIILAPWGESILSTFAYFFTLFLEFVYENIFTPVSLYSMPLALIIFFVIVPSSVSAVIMIFGSLYKKSKKNEDTIKF